MKKSPLIGTIIWLTIFSIAMAFAESAVVVYLRALFYPDGFSFPLKAMADYRITVEVFREFATILMLSAVACLSGKAFWERFGSFLFCFGIWDIFYYVWLKVLLDWPMSLFDWDVLFLIPLPWIAPVIAPVSIAILMVIFGFLIYSRYRQNLTFRPSLLPVLLALAGVAAVLYSFMFDTAATLHEQMPQPYNFKLLVSANILFTVSFIIICKKSAKAQ